MMRRFKRYKKRSSRSVKMTFQSFVDISTEKDNMKIISVNAGGSDVYKRLAPFFSAYKYYKLGSVRATLVPASTLPVDPTGLSYEVGEQTVDPRDQLTPGMCRITNGEDILENIAGLSGDQQRQLYDNMLLDPRWFKWMLQSGVKRRATPRYWQIGQLHQDKWPGAFTNVSQCNNLGSVVGTAHDVRGSESGVAGVQHLGVAGSDPRGIFQTGHRGVLGWMPTDGLQPMLVPDGNGGYTLSDKPLLASIPEIELFKILMPPVHKTNYFYRMFITETVFFKEPIIMNVNGYRPIDVFHNSYVANPSKPTDNQISPFVNVYATDGSETGGNDGSS